MLPVLTEGEAFVIVNVWSAVRVATTVPKFAVPVIIAVIHDILILVGTMSILGLVLGWEAECSFSDLVQEMVQADLEVHVRRQSGVRVAA